MRVTSLHGPGDTVVRDVSCPSSPCGDSRYLGAVEFMSRGWDETACLALIVEKSCQLDHVSMIEKIGILTPILDLMINP